MLIKSSSTPKCSGGKRNKPQKKFRHPETPLRRVRYSSRCMRYVLGSQNEDLRRPAVLVE